MQETSLASRAGEALQREGAAIPLDLWGSALSAPHLTDWQPRTMAG